MNMYREWAEFYDALYEGQGQSRDIPFLVNLVKKYGGPVLECACGTGRVMIPIAKAGFEIHGIDTSDDMLRVLEKKLSMLPEKVRRKITYEKKDMRNFDIGKKFKTCIIAFSSLYHLKSDNEIRQFLHCVRRNLEGNGTLIIDVFDFNPRLEQGKFILQVRTKDQKGRTISKYAKTVFGRSQVNDCWFRIAVEEKGKRKVIHRKFKLHYLLYDQMWKLLESEKFRVLKVYGNYNSEPYSTRKQNEKMIFVAKKI